jgi:sodium transport system permease protein
MRWSIIRLIWLRELRDQLRDRRTVFMIAILPVFIYPVAGFGLLSFVGGYLKKSSTVEVQGADNLPPPSPLPAGARLALGLSRDPAGYPPLFVQDGAVLRFSPDCFESADDSKTLEVTRPAKALPDAEPTSAEFLQGIDRSSLNDRLADLIVVVPPGFAGDLEAGRQPRLYVIGRAGDDRSALVHTRVTAALGRWKAKVVAARLAGVGLPATFDEPFAVKDPDKTDAPGDAARELSRLLVRVFPFILVMWSLAGALYPAVDLCAGEKERGTMETLLISPASRTEIVWGKFLTIWVFSAATALLNLLSIGLTTAQFMKLEVFNPLALLWGVLLLLPLSAFFSAVCLAVGAYARSSKEGQYYLMPLFFLTMPLIFLTLAPDVTLNPFYSMVPITGVALLLQKLMVASSQEVSELAVYFVPVLGPMIIYSWLALRWAVEQFQREEVLFREAERLDLGLMLRNLFRDKEPLPSTGQALFCFGLLLVLSWLTLSLGARLTPLVQQGVRYLAFVAAPPLFMALFVTSRPRLTLGLRLPPWWAWPAAALLAVLLFLPMMEYARSINQVEAIKAAIEVFKRAHPEGEGRGWPQLAVAALGALAEELAFRGFILSGLRHRLRPWTAVFISSFLFGLSQMNVFQFVPHFVAGVALGFLVLRSGSVLPAMLCHLAFNLLVLGPDAFPAAFEPLGYAKVGVEGSPGLTALAAAGLLGTAALLYGVWRWAPAADGPPIAAVDSLPAEKLAQHASRWRPE